MRYNPNSTARDFFEPLDNAKEYASDCAMMMDSPEYLTAVHILCNARHYLQKSRAISQLSLSDYLPVGEAIQLLAELQATVEREVE